MMTDDKGKSLADQLRAKKQAESADEGQSMADKLRAKKESAAAEEQKEAPKSGVGKMRAAREQAVRQAKEADKGGSSLAAKMAAGVAAAGALSAEESEALDKQIADVKALHRRLLDRVKLTGIVRDTSNLKTQVNGLPGGIEKVRSRGYAFRNYLENKAEVLAEQWQEIDGEIKRWIESESSALEGELREAEQLIKQIDAQGSSSRARQNLAGQLSGALEMLDGKIEAAEKHIKTLYDALRREVSQTDSQLKEIAFYLDEKDAASFNFLAGEAVFMVAKAEWDDGSKKPNGVLFLTDQRLIFEQKEKVGKRLGMFGGQDVQSVLWETPLTAVENIRADKKGFLGGKDMLYLSLGAGAPYSSITVEVKGGEDCNLWAKQINRMVSGDAHDERAIEPDPELIEALRNAPTQCHVCGGMLPQIMRGQLELSCRYCGTVIRL
jgi:predicted  nucleic acid-binding Zn-ribbon protein